MTEDILQGAGPFRVRWDGANRFTLHAEGGASGVGAEVLGERIKGILDEASQTPLSRAITLATGYVHDTFRIDPILREIPVTAPKTRDGDRVITYVGDPANAYRTLARVFEDERGTIRWSPWPCRECNTNTSLGQHTCPSSLV